MSTITVILIGFGLYTLGMIVGFVLRKWLIDQKSHSGVIYITRDEDKILYSLELKENPEELVFMDEVIFKIDTSGGKH
jgi:hypothetical protein